MTKAKLGLVRFTLAVALTVAALAATGTNAFAAEPFDSSEYAITGFEVESSDPRAGARSDFFNGIEMKADEFTRPFGKEWITYGASRRLDIKLPPGLVGDPTAYPTCSVERFVRAFESCPMETAVGTVQTEVFGITGLLSGPIYNLTPGEDQPALFGLKPAFNLYAFIHIEVSADGEITAVSDDLPIGGVLAWSDVTMFGVPADNGTPGPRRPFMTNPTNCTTPLTVKLDAVSYDGYSDAAEDSDPVRTNCEDLPFEPSISVAPTSRVAGGPTGLNVDLAMPQNEDPDTPASAHVKDVSLTLPEGMVLSSSSAAGLGSCSPQEFGYHEKTPITCPLSSKVGEVEVETHILDKPLKGPVYVAKQNDNPFNSLIALYMAPAGSGVELKLAGMVSLDPNTGRLTSTFLNNPQQPFTALHVRLKDGPRAPLALPSACGTYTAKADLTSWAMPDAQVPLSSSFAVDQGCDRQDQFTPGLAAGTLNPTAGAFSPFTLRVTRADDAQQNLSRVEATLPEGLLAKLAGVPLCPEGLTATGNCPAESKVGTTTVGAGAGAEPVFVPQPGRPPTAIYLAGPYKGAPYSLVVKVPAQAGPFDLGTVTVRNALQVDPRTAQVTAKSDPLPQFLQGVPTSYRDVRVDVDRPGFTVNPTSCEPMRVTSALVSAQGQVANPSARFQAGGCRDLRFKPRLKLSLKGKTKRTGHPALRAVLTQPPGQANIDHVSVVLPRAQFIDQDRIGEVCTRPQFAADACPANSVLGTATAYSPLLDQPLSGEVYLRANGGERELPDLVADLEGAIDVVLVGHIDAVGKKGSEISRIRNTFELVPDAPVSRFVMELNAGKKALLENSVNLCKAPQRAVVKMTGQNGRAHDFSPLVGNDCGSKEKRKRGG